MEWRGRAAPVIAFRPVTRRFGPTRARNTCALSASARRYSRLAVCVLCSFPARSALAQPEPEPPPATEPAPAPSATPATPATPAISVTPPAPESPPAVDSADLEKLAQVHARRHRSAWQRQDALARRPPLRPVPARRRLDVDDPQVELTRYRLLGTGFFREVELSLSRSKRRGHVVLIIEVSNETPSS